MTTLEAIQRKEELQKAMDEARTPEDYAKARAEMIEFRRVTRFCFLDDEILLSVEQINKNDKVK